MPNEEKDNNSFSYSYTPPTARERKEIELIKRQYTPLTEKEQRLARLKLLDNKVRRASMLAGISSGAVGCLIFGLGFAMILEWRIFLWGVVVSVVGAAAMVLAYPLYKVVLSARKKKYGKEIIALSEELLGSQ